MRKKLIPLSVGVVLSLAFITGCGEEANPPDTLARYKLTVDDNADYKLVGVETDGYLAGEKVTFGVVSQTEAKVIDEVSAGQLVLNDEGGNIYTFTMPASDVNIVVTMENVSDVLLTTALSEAREGLVMDTVYEERQQYYDTHGNPSGSPSRYAKRVISEMSGDYNRITRYSSKYDYSGDFETEIDVSDTTPSDIYMFAKNPENGYLSTTYLNLNNELVYADVLDSATEANLEWYKTYGNPFNYLTANDFTVDESDANKYHLNVEDPKLSSTITGFAQIIFGDIQLAYHVEDFTITLKDGHLASYEGRFAVPEFEWYESTVLFTGSFTHLGADSLEKPEKMAVVEDEALKTALDALKKHNYTVEVNADGEVTRGYSDGGEHFLQDIFGEVTDLATATPIETYYYEQLSEFDDFTELYEYSVRQSVKIRNEFFTFSSDRDGVQIVPQMVAGFDISSAFFDKEGNTYTLKTEGLPYYFVADDSTAYSPFSSTTINTLKITLGENGDVTFETTDSWGGSETVKYTNVGTTTVAAQVVNTNTDKLTKWEDYLKTQAQADALNEVIPTEIVNILPTPKTSVDSVAPIANVTTAGVAAGKTTTEEGTLDEFEAEVPEDGETLPAYVGSWSNADYDAIELYDDGTGSYGGGWFGESFNYTVDGNVLTGVGEDFIITMTFDPTAKTLVYKYVQTTPNTAQIAMSLDSYGDNVDLQYDDLLVLFSDALGKAGFTYNLENLEEYEFIKTMTISEVECEVSISLGGYNDMFIVEYSMLPL